MRSSTFSGLSFFLVSEYADWPRDVERGEVVPLSGDLGDFGKIPSGEVGDVLGSSTFREDSGNEGLMSELASSDQGSNTSASVGSRGVCASKGGNRL